MTNKTSALAVTGHRPDRLPSQNFLLVQTIKDFVGDHPEFTDMWNGGQLGADLYCALAAHFHDRGLHFCLPFPVQAFVAGWKNHGDRNRLAKLLKIAKTVHYISDRFSNRAYLLRNEFIVDQADTLFAVWDGQKYGGTWHTLNYAREQGKRIYVLYPETCAIREEN